MLDGDAITILTYHADRENDLEEGKSEMSKLPVLSIVGKLQQAPVYLSSDRVGRIPGRASKASASNNFIVEKLVRLPYSLVYC